MMFKGHKAVIISEILAVYVDLSCVKTAEDSKTRKTSINQ